MDLLSPRPDKVSPRLEKKNPLGFEGQAAANDRDPVNPPAPLTHTAPSLAVPEACTQEEQRWRADLLGPDSRLHLKDPGISQHTSLHTPHSPLRECTLYLLCSGEDQRLREMSH